VVIPARVVQRAPNVEDQLRMKELTITPRAFMEMDTAEQQKKRGNRRTRVPEILEVSMRVLASEGNAGFTQRRVASDVGIRLSSLQHYFATREELLQATMEAMFRRFINLYREIARDNRRSPEARMDAIIDETFDELKNSESYGSAIALECWSLAEREPFTRDLMQRVTEELQEIISGLVAKVNPTLTAGECSLRGALLVAQSQGMVVFIRRAGNNAPTADTLQSATKVVWRAITGAP
jgi:AcrR family transcriptional regulator